MSVLHVVLLLIAGVIAGFVNTLAGGGSLLTIPALIFVGLPSTVANATNRVAVTLQAGLGAWRFQQKGVFKAQDTLVMSLPALAGAAVGAFIAAEINREVFDVVLGILLILILGTLFFKPSEWTQERSRSIPAWVQIPVFFFVGIYGGFIQAGVGFLLIAAISVLFGHDLVKTNAIKVTIISLFSLLALIIFTLYGQVMWLYGLVLAVGNMTGAMIGVRFALKRGAGAVRWVVVVAVLISALKLFGIVQW